MDIQEFTGAPHHSVEYFQYDPIFGHSGIPNHKGELLGAVTTTNNRGFRDHDHETSRAERKKRILIIGDSAVWGLCVADQDTISAILERTYPEIEAISLGISGYGPDQALLQLVINGIDYRPDLVVFVLFPDNDFFEACTHEAWGVEKPKFKMQGKELCLANIPPRRASGWPNNGFASQANPWLKLSALYGFFSSREIRPEVLSFFEIVNWKLAEFSNFNNRYQRLRTEFPCIEKGRFMDAEECDGRNLVLNIIEHMNTVSHEYHSNFLVVSKPYEDNYAKDMHPESGYRSFLDSIRDKQIQVIDLFEIGKSKNLTPARMFSCWGHLSPEGNRLMAETIASELSRY